MVIRYYQLIKDMKNSYNLHREMVASALKNGVSKTARLFGTTRKIAYKWLNRYREEGLQGLLDRSRAPRSNPRKIPLELEERILEIRRAHPYLGPYRIKEEFKIPCSTGAIYRVLKQNGLIRRRKKKHVVKRDLREVKKRLKLFELIQIDTKELKDIPKYYPYYISSFPGYMYTARDVRTGLAFVSFARENTSTNASIFAKVILDHLQSCGVNLKEITVQTDNGSEFVIVYNRKNPVSSVKRLSPFEKMLKRYNVYHSRIPPGQKTYNSDVEAFHRIIEDEFFDIEDYKDRVDLLSKCYTYMVYFNTLRINRYKGGVTPLKIAYEAGDKSKIGYNKLIKFKPVILDLFSSDYCKMPTQSVYHVPESDRIRGYVCS